MKKMALLAAAGVMLAVEAAVVRRLPSLTVVENETVATDAMKATAVRSSNAAVFGAALRESGEAVLSGVRLGEAELSYVDERGVFAARSVMVVPAYWDVLKSMFSEDPEIAITIVGDKVVVNGATANVNTLRRVDDAKKMDTARIVTPPAPKEISWNLLVPAASPFTSQPANTYPSREGAVTGKTTAVPNSCVMVSSPEPPSPRSNAIS